MSLANNFKNLERKFLEKLHDKLGFIGRGLKEVFTKIKSFFTLKFTIMLIPHSEKKAINFKISFPIIVFLGVITLTGIAGLSVSIALATNSTNEIEALNAKAYTNEQALSSIKKDINQMHKIAQILRKTTNETLIAIGINPDNESISTDTDSREFLSSTTYPEDEIRERIYTQQTSNLLKEMNTTLEKIASVIQNEKRILQKLPTIWPVERNIGYITMRFGPNTHPFTGAWYLHKGIDIAYIRPVGIMSTADGKVVEQGFDARGYGNYVIIRHNYEFYTRYAHMKTTYVKAGDTIKQGQIIGIMGSTGASTGRHLHYEIMIGAEVIDPAGFLNSQKKHFD